MAVRVGRKVVIGANRLSKGLSLYPLPDRGEGIGEETTQKKALLIRVGKLQLGLTP